MCIVLAFMKWISSRPESWYIAPKNTLLPKVLLYIENLVIKIFVECIYTVIQPISWRDHSRLKNPSIFKEHQDLRYPLPSITSEQLPEDWYSVPDYTYGLEVK